MFIDFLHRFVIDHINCYYFCLRRTQSEESIIVRPRVKIANRNPWYDKMQNLMNSSICCWYCFNSHQY